MVTGIIIGLLTVTVVVLIILSIEFLSQLHKIIKENAKSAIQPNHYISKWERFKMKASVEGVKKEKQ